MNNLKFGVLVCGVLGLVGIFLPMVSMGEISVSVWDAHSTDMGQVILMLVAFGLPAVMGLLGMKGMLRWQAIVAVLGFALAVVKLRHGFFDLIVHGAIGGKLMALGALVGLVCAVLVAAKPEQAK